MDARQTVSLWGFDVSVEDVYGIVLSLFVGVVAVVGSFLTVGLTPGFVSQVFSRAFSRYLPDVIIRFSITLLGDIGQQLNLLMAIISTVFVIGGIVFGTYKIQKWLGFQHVNVPITSSIVLVVVLVLAQDFASTVGAVLPVMVLLSVVRIVEYVDTSVSVDADDVNRVSDVRRSLLVGGVGAALFSVFGVGYKSVNPSSSRPPVETVGEESPAKQYLEQAQEKSFDIYGMDSLVSEDFYEVDINAVNPKVERSRWELSITGAVEDSVSVSFEDVEQMETVRRFETLRCVGEDLNGEKMDNALWTGTPVMQLVEEAGVRSDCECVMVRAEDGYFEEFPLDALENGLLAYKMNGKPLPRSHGAPVRLLVPGHWGEINVKWVTEIELLEREAKGYWEKRGWHGTGPVNTVAKLHAVNTLDDGVKQIGGHAYAGTRGVSAVEVSLDGGETWNEAELTEELEPGIDVWRIWKYEYEPPAGTYEVVVRAIDKNGTVQPKERSGAFPSGPTGWVSRKLG